MRSSVLCILLVIVCSGCRSARPVEDESVPRVVSLIPSATELLFAIGGGDLLVGRSQHCDFPPEVSALPSVGSGLAPDIERMIALQPTVVVVSELMVGSPALASIEAAGFDVLVLPDASLDDVPEAARILGARLHLEEGAGAVADAYETGMMEVRERWAETDPVGVLLVVDRPPIFVAGGESRIGELISIAGGRNVVSEGDWVQLDIEAALASAPEVLVEPRRLASDPFWDRYPSIPAVATGRVCYVDGDRLTRPGPRLVDAANELAACLHP